MSNNVVTPNANVVTPNTTPNTTPNGTPNATHNATPAAEPNVRHIPLLELPAAAEPNVPVLRLNILEQRQRGRTVTNFGEAIGQTEATSERPLVTPGQSPATGPTDPAKKGGKLNRAL
jgi:hypothetical protein